jgi:hypothetical protein
MPTKSECEWRPVVGWEGFYEVSDTGLVRSLARRIVVPNPVGILAERNYRGRVLRSHIAKNGYPMVCFTAPGKARESRYVHDLVLAAFVGPKPAELEVCHNNGARHDNALTNLRYDTRKANAADRKLHGTDKVAEIHIRRGSQVHTAKLTEADVLAILRAHPARSIRGLARDYGVTQGAVQRIVRRTGWRHVTGIFA